MSTSAPLASARVDTAHVDPAHLDELGCAPLGRLIEDDDCRDLRALFEHDEHFRATIDMARHRFGSGRYKYFRRPYPPVIETLRQQLYPQLLPIARDWAARLRRPAPWPDTLDEWTAMCHAAGQRRSTAILLRYAAGDWNALHRDLYGELVFPLQVVIGLSAYDADYTGGEFMLVEQRPRAQSRGTAIPLTMGHGLVFTTRDRPIRSARGWTAAPVRHGVSVVRGGTRFALGIVLHDAE